MKIVAVHQHNSVEYKHDRDNLFDDISVSGDITSLTNFSRVNAKNINLISPVFEPFYQGG